MRRPPTRARRTDTLMHYTRRIRSRLSQPMIRRRGDRGFSALSWEEALDLAAARLSAADPNRVAFYLASRGIPNETYYAAQKVARFLGSSHVDNSARSEENTSELQSLMRISYAGLSLK